MSLARLLIACLLAALLTNQVSATPLRLKAANAFASRLPELGSQGVEAAQRINKQNRRGLNITLYGPGKLAPPGRYLDPVIVGAIDGAWSAPSLLANRNPAFGLYGGPPFGLDAANHMEWLAGPGASGYASAYAKLGLNAVPCGVISGQAFGWFQAPIETVDDLNGQRIGLAQAGPAALVLRKIGMQVRFSSPASLHVMALSGAVSAVTLGPYRVDLRMRTHQVAKYGYAPNPLAPAYVLDFIFGTKRWQSLPTDTRAGIKKACDENITAALSRQKTAAPASLQQLAQDAPTLTSIPDDVAHALFGAWQETSNSLATKNPDFAEAAKHYPWDQTLPPRTR